MVQHLVSGTTSILLILLQGTEIHTHTLASPTLLQVEYKAWLQSWLGLGASCQMTGKCLILLKSLFIVSLSSKLTVYDIKQVSGCKTAAIFSITCDQAEF